MNIVDTITDYFKNYKKVNTVVIIFMAALGIICAWITCLVLNTRFDTMQLYNIDFENVDGVFINGDLNTLEEDENFYTIIGWLAREGESIEFANSSILLKDLTTEQFFMPKKELVFRDDVDEHFDDGEFYQPCGFAYKISKKHLTSVNGYQIYFLYNNNTENMLISTNEIIGKKEGN